VAAQHNRLALLRRRLPFLDRRQRRTFCALPAWNL
jgi:hypothetical protein